MNIQELLRPTMGGRSAFLLIPLLGVMTACGGGGDGLGEEEENVPGAPVAVAGEDQTVSSGATVEIYSWDSYDDDGVVVSYSWEQTGGTAVMLDDTGYGIASFTAPPSGESDLELTFVLTVVDDEGKEDTDTVVITVEAQGSTPDGIGQLHSGAVEPEQFTVVGNRAFFEANGTELWITDGTFSGSYRVKQMRTDYDDAFIGNLTPFNGGVIFTASTDTNNGAIWFSDGTEAGTRMVYDVTPDASENVRVLDVEGDYLYFMADDDVHGFELWVTDGTAEGTHIVADTNPGTSDTYVEHAIGWNGKFYFYGYTGTTSQLYVTGGSVGDVVQLTTNVSFYTSSVLNSYDMIVFENRLYFTWHSNENGRELWVTDGTPAGTELFKNIAPETEYSEYSGWPEWFQIVDGKLMFFAYEFGTGAHKSLWSSDGTEAGTQLVKQVDPGVLMDEMVPMNGKYYFAGRPYGVNEYTLWVTDGTSAGTYEVSPDVEPEYSDQSKRMKAVGNKLIFFGTDHVNGFEPWVSDGTAGGTFMLKNIHPTTGSVHTTYGGGWVVARGSKAYFIAAPNDEDFQLFETDGTSAGTKIIAPADATVTVNPMGQEGFANTVTLMVPTLLGNNTFVFRGGFHGTHTLYKM